MNKASIEALLTLGLASGSHAQHAPSQALMFSIKHSHGLHLLDCVIIRPSVWETQLPLRQGSFPAI